MKPVIEHKLIIATLMLSPFYWTLTLKERVGLVKQILGVAGVC